MKVSARQRERARWSASKEWFVVTVDLLEKTTGTFEMIARLYLERKLNTTELIERVHVSQRTAYRAIEKLKEFGLVNEEVEGTFPKRKNYVLSKRGLRLAETPIYRWNSLLRNWIHADFPKESKARKPR